MSPFFVKSKVVSIFVMLSLSKTPDHSSIQMLLLDIISNYRTQSTLKCRYNFPNTSKEVYGWFSYLTVQL